MPGAFVLLLILRIISVETIYLYFINVDIPVNSDINSVDK